MSRIDCALENLGIRFLMDHTISVTTNKSFKFTFTWINSESINHVELKDLLKIIQFFSQEEISILKQSL